MDHLLKRTYNKDEILTKTYKLTRNLKLIVFKKKATSVFFCTVSPSSPLISFLRLLNFKNMLMHAYKLLMLTIGEQQRNSTLPLLLSLVYLCILAVQHQARPLLLNTQAPALPQMSSTCKCQLQYIGESHG